MSLLSHLRDELRPTIKLAIPLVLAELGWMSMSIVDTMMVGRLPNSAVAIGAVALGSNVFTTIALFASEFFLASTRSSRRPSAQENAKTAIAPSSNSIYLSTALTPLLLAPVWLLSRFYSAVGANAAVVELAVPYVKALAVGLWPLLLYFAVRRCLQAMDMVRPVAFALVSANIINAVGNYVSSTAGGASPISARSAPDGPAAARAYMALVSSFTLLWYDRKHRTELLRRHRHRFSAHQAPHRSRISRGDAVHARKGVFALVTALIARLGPVLSQRIRSPSTPVAFTYMVPLGISSAAAVRVGQAIGRKDARGAAAAGKHFNSSRRSFYDHRRYRADCFSDWIARVYTPALSSFAPQAAPRCGSRLSNSSMASKPLLLARSAAPATRAHRCSGPSPPTGSSVYRSVIGSVFRAEWEPRIVVGLSLALILIGIVFAIRLAAWWWRRLARTI